MKPLISTLILFLSFFSLLSQPTLTQGNNTNSIGSQADVFFCDTTAFQPGPAGSNVTWNFPNLVSTLQATLSFKSPSNTTGGSLFPAANLAGETNYLGNIDRSFFLDDVSGRFTVGAISNAGSTVDYTDFQQLISFPFTYNDTFTDNFEATTSNMGSMMTRKGTAKVLADAYGSLTTPIGTFNNVIRIKTIMQYKDSSDFLGDVAFYDEVRWEWFSPSSPNQLMTHSRLRINFLGTISTINSVTYQLLTGMSLEDENNSFSAFKILPGSNQNQVTLLVQLENPAKIQVELYSLNMQKLAVYAFPQPLYGNQKQELDLPHLSPGVYFFKIEDERGKSEIQKWIVR